MQEKILKEEIKKANKFQGERLNKEDIEKSIVAVIKKVDLMMDKFGEKFPFSSSVSGKYEVIENIEWTTSFWTGMLWLSYEYTGMEKYKNLAEKHIISFKERIERKGPDIQHHDIGFLYTLSCVAGYKLTGDEVAKSTAVEAADFLITRYLEKAGIIQAWGNLNDPKEQGRMIIDCNLNLPLLYWASEVTKNEKYKKIAYSHVKMAQKYIIREDSSTFHTFYMDIETGKPKYGKTHQGAFDDSCWARGQAWGVYGFPLSYKYTEDNSLLETSKKLANYFLNRLPEDLICYWDLIFTDGSKEPRDSSSCAIFVCGLLEMIKYLPITDVEKEIYTNAIFSIMRSLIENYQSYDTNEEGVLKHGTYALPQKVGIDEFCSWGDYYYFEALTRMLKTWKLYW